MQQDLYKLIVNIFFAVGFAQIYDYVGAKQQQLAGKYKALQNSEWGQMLFVFGLLFLIRLLPQTVQTPEWLMIINLNLLIVVYISTVMTRLATILPIQVEVVAILWSVGLTSRESLLLCGFVCAALNLRFVFKIDGNINRHPWYHTLLPLGVGLTVWFANLYSAQALFSIQWWLAVAAYVLSLTASWWLTAANQRRHQQLQELAAEIEYDALTGVRNWHAFKRDLDAQQQYALMMLDIDDFKKINDTAGHLLGNTALITFTQTLQTQLQTGAPAAQLYRTGGEEFAIIIPELELTAATTLARTCLHALRQMQVPTSSGALQLTASIGVTVNGDCSEITQREIFQRADMNLYAAKRNGKNRLVVSDCQATKQQELID